MRNRRTWSCCKSTHGIKYSACMGNKTCSNCCWNLIHSYTESVYLVLLHPVVERVVLSSCKLLFSYFACLLLVTLLHACSLGLTTAVGITSEQIAWLQNIQNNAARQVFRKSKQKHVTTVHVTSEETPLASCSRTHFLLTANSHSGTLTSLYHLTSPAVCPRSHAPSRPLRSSSQKLLTALHINLKSASVRSFQHQAPVVLEFAAAEYPPLFVFVMF